MKKHNPILQLTVLFVACLLLVACGGRQPETTPSVTESVPTAVQPQLESADNAYPYPGPATSAVTSPYPGPAPTQELLDAPPNPLRILPETNADLGVVGGVLVQEVTTGGYLPVQPLALGLGVYLENSRGEPALIRYNDSSPHAQLYNTGVFLFTDVEPGIYALIINLGFTQFVVQNGEGYDLVVEVEAGKALDLGQVFVRLPQD